MILKKKLIFLFVYSHRLFRYKLMKFQLNTITYWGFFHETFIATDEDREALSKNNVT